MTLFQLILLGFLIVCAVSVSFSRNLLNSVLIYMSFSLVMSILWVCLESPDLAITEAAVGAGVTSILFFTTLKKIQAIEIEREAKQQKEAEKEEPHE
ncbi:MAG: Na(+)/H(+) antiporter subunit B [Suilimivivens sp.]